MSQSEKNAVQFSYCLEEAHRQDFQLGHQHQAYANDQRIMHSDWIKRFGELRFNQSIYAGLIGGLISSAAVIFLPRLGLSPTMIAMTVAMATTAAVFWMLKYVGTHLSEAYQRAYVDGVFDGEMLNVGRHDVLLGPEGIEVATGPDSVKLGWRRFILCVVQKNSLVMVFHGSVYVLPADVLPLFPEAMGEQVQRWADASGLKAKAANNG